MRGRTEGIRISRPDSHKFIRNGADLLLGHKPTAPISGRPATNRTPTGASLVGVLILETSHVDEKLPVLPSSPTQKVFERPYDLHDMWVDLVIGGV